MRLKPTEDEMTLQERIDELQEQLNELNALVDKENKPAGYWVPEMGSLYFTYDGNNYSYKYCAWYADIADHRRLSQHRVFKSESTRDRIVRVQKILDEWKCKNIGKLDYSMGNEQSKWGICLNSIDDGYFSLAGMNCNYHDELWFFLSKQEAESCVAEIGKEEMTFYARHRLGLLTEDEL